MTLAEAKKYAQDPLAAQRDAERVLEKHQRDAQARASRARVKTPHRAASEADAHKAEKKQQRREQSAEAREAVFQRAGAWCEFCGMLPPAEWHHVIAGGLRRARESVETTAAICRLCHRDWHGGRFVTFIEAEQWAKRHGFAAALRSIRYRMNKRETAAHPERHEVKP